MLMVLPVHGTATRTELTVLPAADGMIAPHGSVGVPALDWGAPELPAGSPPQPRYPSDEFRTASGGPGPVPSLSSAIDRHGFPAAWAQNLRGQGVTLAIVDNGVDFGHPDLNASYAIETNPASPYVGWPLAFDPKSMAAFLGTGLTDGTWYANTSRSGAGPFEVTHTIKVDGTNDFGEAERAGTDPRDNSGGAPGGDKLDYDLTDLYVTRDENRWYLGFSAYLRESNDTYVLLLDLDNETGGTTTVPGGKLADTNTSATDIVTDVAFSPNGQMVATVSADRYLRVWERSTGRILFSGVAHTTKPSSVAWSPDGTKIATADPNVLVIWDTATWQPRPVQYVPSTDTIDENAVLGWSPNSTWIAAGTNRHVHIINANTGARVGTIWASIGAVNAARFNRFGNTIATGLSDGSIVTFDMNATNIQTYPPATRAVANFTLSGVHTNAVLDLTWNSDDTRMVSGGRDNRVVLWNVPLRSRIADSTVSGGWVTGVEWRKDGLGFVSVSAGFAPILPRLIYWTAAGAPSLTLDQRGAMTGVDTSVLGEVATSSQDMTARLWSLVGTPLRIFVAHRSDAAIVVNGWSRYSDRDASFAHGLDIAEFWRWNATAGRWQNASFFDPVVNGTQASFQFGDRLFNELSLPRSLLGDPPALSLELFSAGRSPTKPQDTAPSDPNVAFKNLDLGPGALSLGAFAYRQPGFYTVDPAIVSLSSRFHFGYHPSPILARQYGSIGLLVVDPGVAGRYDTVIVDLDNDHRFTPADVRLSRSSPVAALDFIDGATGLPGRDGIADVSGGLMYFIADGTLTIPYSDRYVALQLAVNPNLVNRIPANGELVAFTGEFVVDPATGARSDHGTRMASLLVGQGRLTPPAQGVAPAAKLLALGNAMDDIVSSWYFAVEGYDGQPATGDEAKVVLSPFTLPTIQTDGFDLYSRTADFLSEIRSAGDAFFVAPAGDLGFGYGSIPAPASAPAVLAVARAEDGTYRSSLEGGAEGPNAHFTDLAMSAARGPTAMGTPKPDLVAIGAAITDLPLHSAPGDGTTAVAASPLIGSDVSAAIAAGAAAIVRQAYQERYGAPPAADLLADLLRSGAMDLAHDALVQGSGFLDVAESVRLARGLGGLLVSPGALVAGDYRGLRAASFPRILAPGASDALSLRVENRGSVQTIASVSDAAYTRLGAYTIANATVRDLYSPNGDITFWLNGTGVSKVDGTTLAVLAIVPPIPGAWAGADLVKVTATSDIDRLVWRTGVTTTLNYSYTLSAMDWQVNASNWVGVPYGPFPAPAIFRNELNTIAETAHVANVLEVRVARPATSVQDSLVVHLGETSGGTGLLDLNWTFTVELYARADWAWISESPGSLTIPGGANRTASIGVSVAPSAGIGIYEGFVLVTNTSSGRTQAVPLVVNVAASGPDIHIGGNLLTTDLYDNNRLFGGNDFTLRGNNVARPYLGDWRFYFLDIPDNGMFVNPRGLKLVIDLRWDVKPSDLDIRVFGRAAADAFSTGHGDRYGPAPLSLRGKTEEVLPPDFKTATNQSEDVLAIDLRPGLNVVAIHATRLKGVAPSEPADGIGGWVRVRPNVDISTPDLAGNAGFTFLSSLDLRDGLRASAVGPATTVSLPDEPIPQDWQSWWNFPNFGEFLWRGSFNYTFNLTKALILEVHLMGKSDVSDLDLGVFRDINGNGKLDPDEVKDANSKNRGGNEWMYDADGDADETVKWLSPPDGQYFVKVLGFTVNAALGHFDLDVSITLDTGKGYEIPEAPKPTEIVRGTEAGLAPFTLTNFSMAWDFPGDTVDGDYGGAVLLGLPRAPGVLLVPVSVGLDRLPPSITDFSLTTVSGRLNEADNRTTTDPSPTLLWSLADLSRGELDATRVSVALGGTDVTSDASVNIQLGPNALGVQAFWEGTVTYVPRPLAEGVHDVVLTVGDLAGNLASHAVTLVVDTTGPTIAIDGPSLRFTRQAVETLTAVSDPGASVSFGGPWIPVGPSGRVSTTVSLLPGANAFRVTAADWFDTDPSGAPVPGNPTEADVTVIQDSTSPRFSRGPTPDEPATRADGVTIRGTVAEEIAPGIAWSPADVVVTVRGARAAVGADGSFEAVVALQEGLNPFEVVATDLAGNEARTWANVTRDSRAPVLTVDAIPARVTTGVVAVSGTTEPGTLVTVNGFVVPVNGDRFLRNVTLSAGENTIVVRVEDAVGNVDEQRFSVALVAAPGDPWTAVGLVAAAAIGAFLLAFLLARRFLFPPTEATEEPEEAPSAEEAPSEGEAAPREGTEEAPPATEGGPEEAPAPPAVGPVADEEEELRDLDEALAGLEEGPPAPEDPRVTRLRDAFESGKIGREVYEANLKRLGKVP
ncbi:MAG TPA: S8 family serine peptidase [Thermoplasmata archaeon]|nr:S8 family serine peptidase [Thermoplasmata archaeon]